MFISHAGEDKVVARSLFTELNALGIEAFVDKVLFQWPWEVPCGRHTYK